MARMVWFSEWWTRVASCHSTQCYLLRRYMLIHNTFHYFMHTHAPIQGAIETRNGGWRSRGTRHMQTHRITPMFPCAAPVLCDDECVYWLQLNIIEGKQKENSHGNADTKTMKAGLFSLLSTSPFHSDYLICVERIAFCVIHSAHIVRRNSK